MYLIQVHYGAKAKIMALKTPPVGANVDSEIADLVDRLEMWGSSFEDSGADYCEIRLYSDDNLILIKRIEGY